MLKSKVSIIVPVYNVEEYLEKCLSSICNQTYTNLEIIIVDDGTKDRSGEIADKINAKDDRVIVVHKANGGVSSARNVGLKKATGDYIVFVDSDDYLEKDYVEYYVSIIEETNADVICGLNHFSVWNPKVNNDNSFYSLDNISAMVDIYTEKINVAVWNKMYSRDLIIRENIIFDENIWYGEGMLFNIELLQKAKNIVVANKKVYHQTFNPHSAMRDFNLNSNLCGLKSLDIQKSKWIYDDKELLNAWQYHQWYFCFSIVKGLMKIHDVVDNQELCNQCITKLRKNRAAIFKVNLSKKRKLICIFISLFPSFAAKLFVIKDKIACVRARNV